MEKEREVEWSEVAQHNTFSDCWVVLNGVVHDLTQFLNEHPGGAAIILKYAGKDGTKAFASIHPKDIVETLPKTSRVGVVVGNNLEQDVLEDDVKSKIRGEKPPLSLMLNLYDFQNVARMNVTPEAWAYLVSAGDDEITMRENSAAYRRIWFRPRILRDVSRLDLSTTMLGTKCQLPFYITATALGRLYDDEGEIALCRAAASRGIIQMCPSLASCTLEEMLDSGKEFGCNQWFQLYVNPDRKMTERLVRFAEQEGCKGLFVTVDAPALGRRERDMRLKATLISDVQEKIGEETRKDAGTARALSSFIDPSLQWSDIKWLRRITNMKIVLKGVQTVEDALLAVEYNVDGIVVSNHGGRQLDLCRSGVEILSEICDEFRSRNLIGKMEIFVDGGIRRGADIVKCLALGAKGVGIGRAFLFALSAYGAEGVEKCIDLLREELEMNMRLIGARCVSEVERDMVITRNLKDHFEISPPTSLDSGTYEPMRTALEDWQRSKL